MSTSKVNTERIVGALKLLEAGRSSGRQRGRSGVASHDLCLGTEVWRHERGRRYSLDCESTGWHGGLASSDPARFLTTTLFCG